MLLIFITCFVILIAPYSASSDNAYSRLVERYTSLSLQAVNVLIEENPTETVVTSMYPAISNLAILALHSDEITRDMLLEFLQFENCTEVRETFQTMTKELYARYPMKIYASCDYEFNEDFVQDYKNIFQGEVGYIDYSNLDNASEEINECANNQTRKPGVDTPLITPNDFCSKESLIAVSALEFTVAWEKEPDFKVMDFQISNCEVIQVATLYGDRQLKYANVKSLDAQFIDLPLNKECFVRLIAPNTVNGLPKVMRNLECSETYNDAVNQMKDLRGMIYVPLGEIFRQNNLKTILQSEFKNITIFNPKDSGLDGILKNNNNTYICNMLHRTNLIGSKQLLNKDQEDSNSTATSNNSTTEPQSVESECTIPEVKVKYPFVYIILCKGIIQLIGTYYGNV